MYKTLFFYKGLSPLIKFYRSTKLERAKNSVLKFNSLFLTCKQNYSLIVINKIYGLITRNTRTIFRMDFFFI